MFRRFVASLFALSLACSSSADVEVDEAVAEDGDLGKAEGNSELKVRVAGTSVWLRTSLAVRPGEDPLLVLHARTSRNLDDARAFIMDDIYGDMTMLGPRTFEITWPISTARGLLDGVDLFLGMGFVHSSSRPDNLTARVVVQPRLSAFSGSSKVYLVAGLAQVVSSGRVMYRLRGTTNEQLFSATARAGDIDLGTARLVDDRHFEIDIEPNTALAIIGGATPITVRANVLSGVVEKSAVLGAAVQKAGLTEGDAYEVWPRECTDELRDCLTALPVGTLDLGSCGAAFAVNACAGEVGVFVSASVAAERAAEVDARLADPSGFAMDASALVGADRVEAFTANARASVVGDVEAVAGRWFLDVQALDAVFDTTVEGALDRVYAYPLVGLPALAPAPGDEAATRQVVADALLEYLAQQDYVHSEFSRSYVDLAHEFRAQHVASLRAFRETVPREDYPGEPTLDVYVGDWLGAYTEISVDKATGEPTRVYVELD